MKIRDVIDLLSCEILTPATFREDQEINYGFSSDLMSDALMILNTVQSEEVLSQSALITGLATNQAVRTAEMLDVNVLLMVRDKQPSTKVLFLAEQSNIIILKTKHTMFNTVGLLYEKGVKGIIRYE